jgi:predicted amidophosphoribosyltransferase
MPVDNDQSDGSDHDRFCGRSSPHGRRVCDYCGAQIRSDGGYRALLSVAAGQVDPLVVVACSRDHLEELISQHR